ncbi:hypothetical protein [Candidatus Electrothrix sp.]
MKNKVSNNDFVAMNRENLLEQLRDLHPWPKKRPTLKPIGE